jgi:hypothetical protein
MGKIPFAVKWLEGLSAGGQKKIEALLPLRAFRAIRGLRRQFPAIL